MNITLRNATPEDAPAVGPVCYEAFKSISDHHRFTPDFPSAEATVGLLHMLLQHPEFYGIVAEYDGKIVGSNFLDERSKVAGLGPITVAPTTQNQGVGRRLMEAMIDRASTKTAAGVRLVQLAYHNRSLCLYTTLGFQTREPLSIMQGTPPRIGFAGYDVRPALATDIDACNALCRDIHGFARAGELKDAIDQNTATVVEHVGEISGYATMVGFFGHTVARTDQDLIALISAAPEYSGPGFLLPTRNHRVLSWCLSHRLRLVAQATLMTIGLYNDPEGAYMPSVLY
jgi:predicted N-acetyltransferase YhbS